MATKARAVLAALLLAAGMAQAAPAEPPMDPALLTEGFLAAHPDLRWRLEGLRAYEAKDYDVALTRLQRAARHADKPAQALIADMYWRGVGVAQDRPLAYAWMDIAAERLYPVFVGYREAFWAELTPAEREDALRRGRPLLGEFGDDVAKPRLESVLKRHRRNITGSRVGFVGNLTIIPFTGPLAGTGMTLTGDEYYADKYWNPVIYWEHQDAIWSAPPRGRVKVGDVERAAAPPEGGAKAEEPDEKAKEQDDR